MDAGFLRAVNELSEHSDEAFQKELALLVEAAGHSLENIEIDQLRRIAAEYLQEVFLEIKDNFEDEKI